MTAQPKHFIVRVDRETLIQFGDTINFERYYHATAENAEAATIKINRFLFQNFDMDNFPDAFFANPDIIEKYRENPDAEDLTATEKEIFELIKGYEERHYSFPYANSSIIYDEEDDNNGLICEAVEISENTYIETQKLIDYINVE